MIERALDTLVDELNAFLHARFPNGPQKPVELGPVHDLTKNAPDSTAHEPFLRLTLVRIEEERINKSQVATRRTGDTVELLEPELKLNLHLLISAHAAQYRAAIQNLSAVIGFFQARPTFTPANTPGLDTAIQKLLAELQSPSFEELNQLFGMLSAGYRPCVLYRVRLLVVQESVPVGTSAGIGGVRLAEVKA